MGLGRNEEKHLLCSYVGRENECPNNCAKCAISIKTDGDIALTQNLPEMAIKHYKRAVFVEPKFAEAWCNMGNAYGMKSEYNNAISAFNKAILIDPLYGKALFGKAITLRNQGKLDEALAIANEILDLYEDSAVDTFIADLTSKGARDNSRAYSLEKAIDVMTDKAYGIAQENHLLDANGKVSTEKEIYCKEDFAASVFSYCKKRYATLGNDKVWSESILASFYGSMCTTLLFYTDQAGFNNVSSFEYLNDHINLDELDRNAEKLLGIRDDKSQCDTLWNTIASYVKFCKSIINNVEVMTDMESAVLDASESAYMLGMLVAMQHQKQVELAKRRYDLDRALEKLAESTKDYNYVPPDRSAMCYSISIPPKAPVYYRCDICGKTACAEANDEGGKEQKTFDELLEAYRGIAEQFTALGWPSEIKRICDDCAAQRYPSSHLYTINNMIFSLTRKDCGKVINSYPLLTWFNEMPYKIALAFLNGADTLQILSEKTDTKLSADAYLEHIHSVLGDVSGSIR